MTMAAQTSPPAWMSSSREAQEQQAVEAGVFKAVERRMGPKALELRRETERESDEWGGVFV